MPQIHLSSSSRRDHQSKAFRHWGRVMHHANAHAELFNRSGERGGERLAGAEHFECGQQCVTLLAQRRQIASKAGERCAARSILTRRQLRWASSVGKVA